MSEHKLRPCPFCAGEAKKNLEPDGACWISCWRCGVLMETYDHETLAAIHWNHRPSDWEAERVRLRDALKIIEADALECEADARNLERPLDRQDEWEMWQRIAGLARAALDGAET